VHFHLGSYTDEKAWQDAMQIHWMKNKKTLAESIPPVFSRYILEEFFRSYGEDI
jgi:hypothetical protein